MRLKHNRPSEPNQMDGQNQSVRASLGQPTALVMK